MNLYWSSQALPRDWRGVNTPKTILWSHNHADTKTRWRQHRNRKLQTNIFNAYRCKNSQQNISRLNTRIHWERSSVQFSSVQSLSHVRLFATPWIAACQASLSITNSRSSLRLVHRVRDAIQPSHPLLSPSPPAPNPSQHQSLFQWVNSLHNVAKVLEFQL